MPAIHPYLPLNGSSVVALPQFAKGWGKDGEKTMFLATSGLALTAFRLFTHRGYLESIWNEYRKRVKYK